MNLISGAVSQHPGSFLFAGTSSTAFDFEMPATDTPTRPPTTSSPIFMDQADLDFTFAVPVIPAIHTFMESTQTTDHGKSYLCSK